MSHTARRNRLNQKKRSRNSIGSPLSTQGLALVPSPPSTPDSMSSGATPAFPSPDSASVATTPTKRRGRAASSGSPSSRRGGGVATLTRRFAYMVIRDAFGRYHGTVIGPEQCFVCNGSLDPNDIKKGTFFKKDLGGFCRMCRSSGAVRTVRFVLSASTFPSACVGPAPVGVHSHVRPGLHVLSLPPDQAPACGEVVVAVPSHMMTELADTGFGSGFVIDLHAKREVGRGPFVSPAGVGAPLPPPPPLAATATASASAVAATAATAAGH